MAENLPTAANEVRNIERPSDPVHENGKQLSNKRCSDKRCSAENVPVE